MAAKAAEEANPRHEAHLHYHDLAVTIVALCRDDLSPLCTSVAASQCCLIELFKAAAVGVV